MATWGGGLARLNPETGEVVHYDHASGLPSGAVFDILEDDHGRLWLSTSNGLSRFDPGTETFHNYDEQDGLPGNAFESAVAFQSPSGEMFFGATNGLLAFDPDQIHDNAIVPPVVITDLLLANKPVPIGDGSVLRQPIDETAALTLSYLDRVISFEFAALDFTAPQKNRYRYKLEGFDQAWTEVGSDHRLVTYTNWIPAITCSACWVRTPMGPGMKRGRHWRSRLRRPGGKPSGFAFCSCYLVQACLGQSLQGSGVMR